ncbi:MAG TPA: hypothetical protein VKQ36_02660 [Ktedonobacterales bacterium]|nr:hypothetical protein [Ktedonobacterales bacterium]
MSASEAATRLGGSQRVAQMRAKEAFGQGDSAVRRIAGAWVAPLAWWRIVLRPKPMGRPRRDEHAP